MKINSSGAPNYYAPYQSKRNGTVSRFAPNAPAEVKQAYVEAAMETNYSEETHMDDTSESSKLEIWHQGKTLDEWSGTDPKYTDSETGISWYVRDGKYPYMTEEDAEKFNRLCKEQGVFPLKKFAEMTGLIQEFDDGTTVYAGDNGIAVKSKNGEELWMDTSSLTYGTIMNILKDLPEHGNYADILEERINEIFVKVKNGDTEAIRDMGRHNTWYTT